MDHNSLSVYVVCKGERDEGASPAAVAYTFSAALDIAALLGAGRDSRLLVGPDRWKLAFPDNDTDQVHIYRFCILNRADEFVLVPEDEGMVT